MSYGPPVALYAFQVYLRGIARKHLQGEVNATDIEKAVKRELGIDLSGKLAELQEPMVKSKAIYDRVRKQLRTTDGFQELLKVPEKRKANLTQDMLPSDFAQVHLECIGQLMGRNSSIVGRNHIK